MVFLPSSFILLQNNLSVTVELLFTILGAFTSTVEVFGVHSLGNGLCSLRGENLNLSFVTSDASTTFNNYLIVEKFHFLELGNL